MVQHFDSVSFVASLCLTPPHLHSVFTALQHDERQEDEVAIEEYRKGVSSLTSAIAYEVNVGSKVRIRLPYVLRS